MDVADPVSEATVEAKQCLIGKRDFGNQHDGLLSFRKHLLNDFQIYFCLAASGNAEQQKRLALAAFF